MDFPVCPACHQSVIDDDAEDCPFCGASMKSTPGAKPAALAAKPTAPLAKPVGAKAAPGKPSNASKPTLPGDDFPFEAELTTGKSAIPAMPNPSKQRTLQVICPMCDTAGYLPATAAGQDVRCANPKCVMPIFTAPAPKKEEPPPPPPRKSSNLLFVTGTTVVLISLIGGGLYFVNSIPSNSGSNRPKEMSEEDKKLLAESIGPAKKSSITKQSPKSGVNEKSNDSKAVSTEISTDDLINLALKQMKDSCLENNKKTQRSKPYCRQLAAEANAITGNAAAAREHLNQLVKVGSDVSYYRIIPLLDLFWVDLAAGNKTAAETSLNDAMVEVSSVPKFGRTRLEVAGRLMAALVAGGRMPDAVSLLADFPSNDADAQLAAKMQIATDGRVSLLSDTDSVLPWKSPLAVAATASLIAREQFNPAREWAASQPTEDARAECLAIWAEDIAYRKTPTGASDFEGNISSAVASLPPALAAQVWARAGHGRLRAKDQAGVTACIKLAQEKLEAIKKPAPSLMPEVKSTIRFKLPNSSGLFQAATAASELAFLQAQSPATKSDAEATLETALAFIDATSPSLAAAKQRTDETNRLGVSGLRELLKKELKLKTDDEVRTKTNNYTKALADILKASQQRFDLETQVLSRLRGAGLNNKVWIIVNSRASADDLNQRDDFFTTGLPSELIEGLKGTDEEQAILGAWSIRFPGQPPKPVEVEFTERLQTDVANAVEFIRSSEVKSDRREEILFRAVSGLASQNKLSVAFQLISKLDVMIVREDCYGLAAAIAAKEGQSHAVWKQVATVTQHTEKVAICNGLITGIKAIVPRE